MTLRTTDQHQTASEVPPALRRSTASCDFAFFLCPVLRDSALSCVHMNALPQRTRDQIPVFDETKIARISLADASGVFPEDDNDEELQTDCDSLSYAAGVRIGKPVHFARGTGGLSATCWLCDILNRPCIAFALFESFMCRTVRGCARLARVFFVDCSSFFARRSSQNVHPFKEPKECSHVEHQPHTIVHLLCKKASLE